MDVGVEMVVVGMELRDVSCSVPASFRLSRRLLGAVGSCCAEIKWSELMVRVDQFRAGQLQLRSPAARSRLREIVPSHSSPGKRMLQNERERRV